MKVEDVMTVDVSSCLPDDSLRDAAQLMAEGGRGSLVVLSDEPARAVLGILTDRDICLAAARDDLAAEEVRSAMSAPATCCRASDDVSEVLVLAENHGFRRFPVVDASGQLLGVVSLDDVARAAARGERALDPREVCRAIGSCGERGRRAQHRLLHD